MFKKILIANRGEIAVRIAKACRELGIVSAAVYSEADKSAFHTRAADESYLIGRSPASESYLNANRIIELALEIGADAIHPGYGFLSENADFIRDVNNSGIVLIGPTAEAVNLMGNKTAARTLMTNNDVPVVPGTIEPITDIDAALILAGEIGYPIMLKAAAGGGGKGMRRVNSNEEFAGAFERASNEALQSFGNGAVYMEKFIVNPKHIEVQLIADTHGNYVHLLERECSVQRRHQKIIEECPSPSVDEELRKRITSTAIKAAKAGGYYNAGTVEFLLDENMNFYFLEMNTRLQVEHPVTEMVTGVDVVKEQINIAAGNKLSITQDDIKINGSAIECRVYAEDTDNNFAPSTGTITHHVLPAGTGIRVDRGIDVQSEVSVYYDPMLAKVIAWDSDRKKTIERMRAALGAYQIAGVSTNINLLIWILMHPVFKDGSYNIDFIDEYLMDKIPFEWKTELNKHSFDYAALAAVLVKMKNGKLKPEKINRYSGKWEELKYE